jgi:hypothetical protein
MLLNERHFGGRILSIYPTPIFTFTFPEPVNMLLSMVKGIKNMIKLKILR